MRAVRSAARMWSGFLRQRAGGPGSAPRARRPFSTSGLESTEPPRNNNIWGIGEAALGSVQDPATRAAVERMVSLNTASASELLRYRVNVAIAKWRRHEADVGSPAVSIAAMSERINHLREHMTDHHKDKHSMYGINRLINKRRYMLKYLSKKDFTTFKALMNEYEISTLELMTDQGASHRGWSERNARRRARRGKRVFPPYHKVEPTQS